MSTGYAAVTDFTNQMSNNVIMRINLPEGTDVFAAPFTTEGEMILKPNASYKISSVRLARSEIMPGIDFGVAGKQPIEMKDKIIVECEFEGYNN